MCSFAFLSIVYIKKKHKDGNVRDYINALARKHVFRDSMYSDEILD